MTGAAVIVLPLPAIALAAALNAWADWADEENKKKDENQ